jgi:hypothetical protein
MQDKDLPSSIDAGTPTRKESAASIEPNIDEQRLMSLIQESVRLAIAPMGKKSMGWQTRKTTAMDALTVEKASEEPDVQKDYLVSRSKDA